MPWWIVAGAGVIVVVATALWWWLPKWQVNLLSLKIRDPKNSETEKRKLWHPRTILDKFQVGFD
jgi:hypothetical protein